jgi:hypothetical protein
MSVQAILLPLFVQVALTFVLLFGMGMARVGVVKSGQVKIRDIALGQPGWPERQTQIANCFNNQFQLPVLFYLLVALALFTRKADLLFVLLSWLFVVLRVAHAWVHVTSNHVPTRFRWYAAGVVVLLAIWVVFAVQILLGL